MGESTDGLLKIALSAVVPLRIMELQGRGGPGPEDLARARDWNERLMGRGDVLLFGGSKKQGEVAELFDGLAYAIAVLSFCPGGVGLFGEHWESV